MHTEDKGDRHCCLPRLNLTNSIEEAASTLNTECLTPEGHFYITRRQTSGLRRIWTVTSCCMVCSMLKRDCELGGSK